MDENLLVLLEPGVEGGPLEPHRVVEPVHLRGAQNRGGMAAVDVTGTDAETPGVTPSSW